MEEHVVVVVVCKVHSGGLKDPGSVLAKLTRPVAGFVPPELVTVEVHRVDSPS